MPNDYGQRGQAAMRLLKGGKKGAPPPEEDLGMPPEDEALPPDAGGGAPPMDLAAMLGGGGPPPPGGEAMPPEGGMMPPDGGMGAQDPSQDLDAALGSVESSLEGLPPEAAEEIRQHLNAIKEIAAGGGGKPQDVPMEDAPTPDAGGMPTPTPMAKEEGAG